MDLPTALATSCDTYFYELGDAFYGLPRRAAATRSRTGRGRFGFGEPTGIDIGRRGGRAPADAGVAAADVHEEDRPVLLGDRPPLEAGRLDPARDRPEGPLVTPLQMARFYALIANGGKLVTPHARAGRRAARPDGGRRTVLRRFTPPPPRATDVDPAALEVVRDGPLRGDARVDGTSIGVFGSFPVAIAGKTGTAEKVVHVAGTATLRTSRGGAATGRTSARARRLRADRERRPRRPRRGAGRAQGLRAVLRQARRRRSATSEPTD